MSLKNTLRSQICVFQTTSSFPVNQFVRWAFGLGIARTRLLWELDELQRQLDIEAEALRHHSDSGDAVTTQQEHWCFYCEQIRAHYRVLLRQDQASH